ncbi:MAG TPA: DUF4367 domain-containing protein [Candidatus Saccharimonadales bacterium]|nr:DUF4367 domain-containing protein [Candidatus Saccharimonadales bacterium]
MRTNNYVAKPISVIEINGNRYDAATGQLISAFQSVGRVKNQVIDGFVKSPAKAAGQKVAAKARVQVNYKQHSKVSARRLHLKTESAHTLMRSGLKSPNRRFEAKFHANRSGSSIDTELRAKQTQKSAKVKRFGTPRHSEVGQAISGEVIKRGHPSKARSERQAAAAPVLPSMIASVSHQKLERLLDEALTRADTHKQALRRQTARHFWQRSRFWQPKGWLSLAVVGVAIVAVLGFLAWQKVPQLSVKISAMRAHVPASVPAYKPDGYKLMAPASASGNAVTVKYQSALDSSKNFTVMQQKSDMNSSTLSQTIVPKDDQVQTSDMEGNTVYIYGHSNNAAWVNNGVLYTIQDNANLSSDEILKVAQGLQ